MTTLFGRGGLPAYLTLKDRGPISLSQTMWADAALGNLPSRCSRSCRRCWRLRHLAAGTMSLHLSPIPELIFSTLRLILLGTALGAASAAVFWFVASKDTDLSD